MWYILAGVSRGPVPPLGGAARWRLPQFPGARGRASSVVCSRHGHTTGPRRDPRDARGTPPADRSPHRRGPRRPVAPGLAVGDGPAHRSGWLAEEGMLEEETTRT